MPRLQRGAEAERMASTLLLQRARVGSIPLGHLAPSDSFRVRCLGVSLRSRVQVLQLLLSTTRVYGGLTPLLRVDGRRPLGSVAFFARSSPAMPSPYGVPENSELLRLALFSTRFHRVCSWPLTDDEAKRATLREKEVKMICTLVALSPAIGALLGFVYGPSINRTLARLVTTNGTVFTPA